MQFAAVHESASGPSPTWRDVRDLVSVGAKADKKRTLPEGRHQVAAPAT